VDLGEVVRALGGRQRMRESAREGLEPADDIAWQRCRARKHGDRIDDESGTLEPCAAILGRGKEPWIRRRTVDAAAIERCDQRIADRGDAAMTAELTDEPATGSQRAERTRDHGVGRASSAWRHC
jgi:hypothetical protein